MPSAIKHEEDEKTQWLGFYLFIYHDYQTGWDGTSSGQIKFGVQTKVMRFPPCSISRRRWWFWCVAARRARRSSFSSLKKHCGRSRQRISYHNTRAFVRDAVQHLQWDPSKWQSWSRRMVISIERIIFVLDNLLFDASRKMTLIRSCERCSQMIYYYLLVVHEKHF